MKKLHCRILELYWRLRRRPNIKASLRRARKEAAELGVILHVDESDFIDNKHLDCFWYGGTIGLIEYDGWRVTIEANGDISLHGIVDGKEVDYKNRNNSGAWGDDVCDIIKNDRMLHRELQKVSITYGTNNWVEFNLIAPDGTFHDLFLMEDNVLDENVLNVFSDLQYYVDVITRHKAVLESGRAECAWEKGLCRAGRMGKV